MAEQFIEKAKASSTEGRRSSKPIMEKRRRARINSSLAELKALLIDVLKSEGTHHSKMEKADILEMTVKHLRQIQRQQFAVAATVDPTVINKYQVGFNECATEVARYLSSIECLDVELRARVLGHLANCLQMQNMHRAENCSPPHVKNGMFARAGICAENVKTSAMNWKQIINNQKNVFNNNVSEIPPPKSTNTTNIVIGGPNHSTTVVASSSAQAIGGIQLLPSRLPTGEVAFIIPSGIISSASSEQQAAAVVPSYVIPVYTSQPTAVTSPSATTAEPLVKLPHPENDKADTVLDSSDAKPPLEIKPASAPLGGCVALDMTMKRPNESVKLEPTEDVWRPW
ncbi:transcription factor HES-4-B-like [Tubulanus polymorphus]|uniref:transcription factor HES-4-B-like n=1 Tax=Tubulanus polymorphus TaxID=672921 RepID=UPI003DA1CD1C